MPLIQQPAASYPPHAQDRSRPLGSLQTNDPRAQAEGEPLAPGRIPLQVLKNLRKLERNWVKRKQDRVIHRTLESLWENARWDDAVLKLPDETIERARDMKPHFMPNILRQIIQPLTYLYDAAPKREVATPAVEAIMGESFWDFGERGRLNGSMSEADRLVRLHGIVWAQSTFRPDPYGSTVVNGPLMDGESVDLAEAGFDVALYPPHWFEVVTQDNDATQAKCVILFVDGDKEDDIGGLTNADEDVFQVGHYWDGEFYGCTNGFNLVADADGYFVRPHDIGQIPGVAIRNEPLTREFWCWGIGGRDCCQDLLDIARLWREYLFTSMLARGQFFVAGGLKNKDEALGPDTIFEGDANSSMTSIKSGADLGGIRTSINTAIEAFARGCGVPASLVRLDEKTTPLSGRAMIMQSAEIEDDWPVRARIFSRAEYALHAIVATAYAAIWGGRALPPAQARTALLDISYEKYQPELTRNELFMEVQFKLNMGLISPLQALRELHPTLSDEEVKRRYDEARAYASVTTPGLMPDDSNKPPSAQVAPKDAPNARTTERLPPSKRPRNVSPDTADNKSPDAHPRARL